jgi:ATP-dependent DNA ligase
VVPPKTARVTYPVQPVKPTTSAELPVGKPGEWSYEPKFDGFVRHEVHVIEGGGRPLRRIVAAMR